MSINLIEIKEININTLNLFYIFLYKFLTCV